MKIKQLEFIQIGLNRFMAYNAMCCYTIKMDDSGYWELMFNDIHIFEKTMRGSFEDKHDAMVAAQADFERRIKECIEEDEI